MATAVVVGAGVGGLAAAGALSRNGWHVTLLERNERLRGSGGALLLWPNGVAAMRSLGLSVGDVAFPVPDGGIRRPDGRWLVAPTAAQGDATAAAAPVVVHADDLHDALMAGLGEKIEIRTRVEINSVRASGDRPAVGTGKQSFEADLIIAADGGRSAIRQRLAPQSRLVPAGYTAWRAVLPWFRAPKLPETVSAAGVMLGAGQRFQHATLGERGNAGGSARGGIYWSATASGASRPESAATQLGLLRRWFAGWQSPVGELLEATEPADLYPQVGEEVRPLPRSFGYPVGGGGIALLGDAAHVATPALSQGACLALEDAATLRAVLTGWGPARPLAAVLEDYTLARRERVARVARTSRQVGAVLQARGRLAQRARDAVLERMPPRLIDRASTAAAEWTPPQ